MAPTRLARAEVTVIVPTKNERAGIDRFLASVPPTVRLVVVDSGNDGTAERITGRRPDAVVVRIDANIPVARQLGATIATTPWLLFADADVCFAPDYFERLEAIASPAELGGIVAVKTTDGGYDRYHRIFVRGQGLLTGLGIPAASGSNMLVRADALQAVGGFDPRLSVNEDTELMFRIARAGWRVAFEPGLSVRAFDHRRLELGLVRKVVHGAVRNTCLWLGVFPRAIRQSDWGYWGESAA